jgi:hypothetical protein
MILLGNFITKSSSVDNFNQNRKDGHKFSSEIFFKQDMAHFMSAKSLDQAIMRPCRCQRNCILNISTDLNEIREVIYDCRRSLEGMSVEERKDYLRDRLSCKSCLFQFSIVFFIF